MLTGTVWSDTVWNDVWKAVWAAPSVAAPEFSMRSERIFMPPEDRSIFFGTQDRTIYMPAENRGIKF